MIKTHTETIIELRDWDELVEETYGKIYSFQQQEGCRMRQYFPISVPSEYTRDDEMHDDIPVVVNGQKRGVKFSTWLEQESINFFEGKEESEFMSKHSNVLFWHRSFYPDVYTLANDLYKKGLIEKGEYLINIDW